MRVDTGINGITIETVSGLYAQYESMNVPAYYEKGESNPFSGRVACIPKSAQYYVMVPEREKERLEHARIILKSIARRKKVREVIREKHEVNYNQFVNASRIVIMYV